MSRNKLKYFSVRKIADLRDMVKQTTELIPDSSAFTLKDSDGNFTSITYREFSESLNKFGTALIDLGLKNAKIAVMSENRYEWAISYLATVTGVGIIIPLDRELPENEIQNLLVRSEADIDAAWDYAQTGGRAGAGRVIVEGFIDFDYEITLLTVRHAGGTDFCEPIGHLQRDGDYRESWQPQPMSALALQRSQEIARAITDDLGGWGLFGVELFVKGDDVWFSEVSPRPHDTGLVTLVSQELSEFALHARAILGLPIHADASGAIRQLGASASCAVLAHGHGVPVFAGVDAALAHPDAQLRLFGKPRVEGHRRVAVTLARAADIDAARALARDAAAALTVSLQPA